MNNLLKLLSLIEEAIKLYWTNETVMDTEDYVDQIRRAVWLASLDRPLGNSAKAHIQKFKPFSAEEVNAKFHELMWEIANVARPIAEEATHEQKGDLVLMAWAYAKEVMRRQIELRLHERGC